LDGSLTAVTILHPTENRYNITTPHKKKRKQQLNKQQKSENKALSSKRIFVKHLIRVVKIFQVASQRFRLNADVYNEIVLLACGLVRLRIGTFVLPNTEIN
jgi:IS5 family transposase